ncbi:MAG: hypothetical protein AAF205_06195 [Pseudomonadota bacterium]
MRSLPMSPSVLAIAACVGTLAACGQASDSDISVQEELAEAPLEDANLPDLNSEEIAAGDIELAAADDADILEDRYDLDGEEVAVTRVRQGPTFVEARAVPLDEAQAERRAGYDTVSLETEVKTKMKEMAAASERLTDPAFDGEASFVQLDRDADGKMSMAEFAIYDLAGVNPTVRGDKEDETMPYVSTTALNMVADDFVRIDTDNDGFLSRSEFMTVVS